MAQPGWSVLVERAKNRIELVKMQALMNTDENEVLTLYRRCYATMAALQEFLQDVEVEIGD